MDTGIRRPRLLDLVVTAFGSAALGGLLALLFLLQQWNRPLFEPSPAAMLFLYGLCAAAVVAISLTGLFLRYRQVPDVQTGLTWVGLGLTAGGLLSLAPAIAFAAATDFSTAPTAVVADGLIVAMCCLLGIATGGQAWLSTRIATSAN